MLIAVRAEGGGSHHAERAADDSHLVGEDVAEHVLGEEDVELRGLEDELHRGVVDVHHREGDVRGGGLEAISDDLAPEDGGLEDVGLVDEGDVLTTGARGGDGDVGDAFDLRLAVDHGVDGFDVPVSERRGGLRSKVEAAGELADADHVDAVRDAVRADRRSVDEVLQQQAGTHVGVEREVLAEGEEGGALRLFGRRQLFPLRAADGTEEDGVRGAAGLEG